MCGKTLVGFDLANYVYEYELDEEEDPIEVYFIPHSHVDAGWEVPYREYYDDIVEGILTTIVEAMKLHEEYKFSWADMSFFGKWFDEQSK
jgi:alpha-mannosidase II